MASSYTSGKIYLEKPNPGEQENTWGATLNTNFDDIAKAISGVLAKSVAGSSDVTLTTAESKNQIQHYTGALTANINVIVPALTGTYFVYNATTGSYTLTVKTASGTGIAVSQGKKAILYCDGTDVLDLSGQFNMSGLVAANNLSDVASAATAFSNIKQAATDTATGVVELATDSETATGTDTVRAITPANLASMIGTSGAKLPKLNVANTWSGVQAFSAAAYFSEATLTDGATVNWDVAAAQVAKLTLGGNRTMAAPSNLANGLCVTVTIIQDGTGSRTLSWNSVFKFVGGSAPTLTTTASAKDILTFRSDGTNLYEIGRALDVK